MALIDNSDNPIGGFLIVHHPEGLYLHCRGTLNSNKTPSCQYRRRINRLIHLEEILALAAAHRVECPCLIQQAPSIPTLPFQILPRENNQP